MMDYNLFKTVFVKRIGDYMPREFRDHEPRINKVKKVNRTRDGFSMVPHAPENHKAIPTIYLEDVYEDFCVDEDMDRVLSNAAYVLTTCSNGRMPGEDMEDFGSMKDKVVMNLINKDMNSELLEDLPHRELMDLAVIYRIVFRSDDRGIMSLIINRDVQESMGVTEEELHDLARENTRRIFPVQIIEQEDDLCVMTNDAMINGATTMLYREDMKKMSERLGGDFFIMPSSIHEFFAIPAEEGDVGMMAAMLAEGNGTITDWSEVLSNSIYMYSADEEELRMCVTCMKSKTHNVVSGADLI